MLTQSCGEVLDWRAAEQANWVHLKFGHADEAQRALSRSGRYFHLQAGQPALHAPQATSDLILGVKALDEWQLREIEEGTSTAPPPERERHVPLATQRPYTVTRELQVAGSISGIEPLAGGWWGNVAHYVFGL